MLWYLFLFLLAACCLHATPELRADTIPARQELTVRFAPETHQLLGNARIDLPANTGALLFLGDLQIHSLEINGKTAQPDQGTLVLEAATSATLIEVSYSLTLPTNAASHGEGLISPDGITLTGFWHPNLNLDSIFSLTAEIPSRFEAISEAEEITTALEGGRKIVRFHYPYPVRGINFVAGPYQVTQEKFGNDQLLAAYFFAEDQDLAADYLRRARQYLERYAELLGPYPFKRFAIVENRLPTGYAMPTFTLLGQAVVRLPFIVDTSLGHEILHEWFGNSVRISTATGNWAEGLTTYLADQAFAAEQGRDRQYRKEQLTTYASYVNAANAIPLRAFQGGIDPLADNGRATRAVGYNKASMVFHMLRKKLGDDHFYAGLRDFFNRLRFRRATWDDLRISFETVSNSDLTIFFRQWLERADLADLLVSDISEEEQDGVTHLKFTLRQQTETAYELSVPIVVTTMDGETITTLVATAEPEKKVDLTLPVPARELVVDPDYDLMRILPLSELPPVWSRFNGAGHVMAILENKEAAELFAPLLHDMGLDQDHLLTGDQVKDEDLTSHPLLLLGTGSPTARALFGGTRHPATGFTVDVRTHPLNPNAVAVLISAGNNEEVQRAAPKLRHYGKYSYLHFAGGRIQEKSITDSDIGQRYQLSQPAMGMALPTSLTMAQIIDRLLEKRVVYVGETHTSNRDHLLQLNIIRALHRKDPRLAIGMEMFNHSTQQALNDYIAGRTDEATFLKASNYFTMWGYDWRLYRPILDYARRHNIPVVALNLEKQVVSTVFKEGGPDGLSDEDRVCLPADRDLDIPGYRQRIESVFTMHGNDHGKGFAGFFQAQALWDETMAETVVDYLQAHPGDRMVVLAGGGHVFKDSGIPPRVSRRLPVAQAVVVNAREHTIDPKHADFILFTEPSPLPPPPMMGVMLAAGENGVTIQGFSPHGQAEKAGVRAGDRIVSLDDLPVATVDDIKIAMLAKKKGDTVTLGLIRPRKVLRDKKLFREIPL